MAQHRHFPDESAAAWMKDDSNLDEEIEVHLPNGKSTTMRRQEVRERMEQNLDGMKMEGDKLTKETKGTKSLTDIAKDDPAMSRFIWIGKWSLEALKRLGHVEKDASIVGLKSLSNNSVPSSSEMSRAKKFNVSIELSIQQSNKEFLSKPKRRYFELDLSMDPVIYPKPYLAILAARELRKSASNSEKTELRIPPIKRVPSWVSFLRETFPMDRIPSLLKLAPDSVLRGTFSPYIVMSATLSVLVICLVVFLWIVVSVLRRIFFVRTSHQRKHDEKESMPPSLTKRLDEIELKKKN